MANFGGKYKYGINRRITGKLERHIIKKDTLTPRELEVLDLVIKDYHNPKISKILCISEHTTKVHLASINEKLYVTNRIQAIIKYLKINKELKLTTK